ncbi:hypothetical protein NECAME_08841, partial [Necator americanus]
LQFLDFFLSLQKCNPQEFFLISAVLTPNSSTGSWQMPKRNNSFGSEDRSVSAVVNRMTQHHQPEPTVTSNGVPSNDSFKKNELNNNHLPLRRSTGSAASNLSKAKSEGNLSEELENSPPINYDEMPIKPAKGGQYFDECLRIAETYFRIK